MRTLPQLPIAFVSGYSAKLHLAAGLFAVGVLSIGATAHAQEAGRVISSTPVIQQVAVPRQTCTTEQVSVEQPRSGAGALMGAIAGGAIGNSVGGGSGKALATMVGVLGGAAMGNNVEGPAGYQTQNVQRCSTQTFYENRPVAYNVVYEYAGKQYQVQMAQDPGAFVQLQVTPVGAQTTGPVSGIPAPVIQPVAVQQPIYQAPAVVATPQVIYAQPQVVYQQPAVVYTRPYYPVVYPAVSIGFGWRGGYAGGYRRWH